MLQKEKRRVEDASEYAMIWIIGTKFHDIDKVSDFYQQWMDYYDEEKIEPSAIFSSQYGATMLGGIGRTSMVYHGKLQARALKNCYRRSPYGTTAGHWKQMQDCSKPTPRLAEDIHIQQELTMGAKGLQAVETRL